MRTIISVLLLLALCGCQSEPRQDAYLEAIGRYNASLYAAEAGGQPVGPPPKPTYLECTVQPEPAQIERGCYGESMYGSLGVTEFSGADCERTNAARKQAYEDALRRYQQTTSDSGARPQNGSS